MTDTVCEANSLEPCRTGLRDGTNRAVETVPKPAVDGPARISRCIAARDRTTPRNIASKEASTEVMASLSARVSLSKTPFTLRLLMLWSNGSHTATM